MMRFESAFSGCFIAFLLLVSSFSKAQMPKEKSKQKKGPSRKKSSIGKGKSKGGKKKGPPKPRNTSDVIAFWYKPHFQCNGADGSTPARAARFINQQLEPPTTVTTTAAAVPAPAADFVGISEWTGPQNLTIGNPEKYGVIGAVCGYGKTEYTTPMALFYRYEHWSLQASYPPRANQCDVVPTLPWTGPQIGPVCKDKVSPTAGNCCSCTYSEQEYQLGNALNANLGQRPWVAGKFVSKTTTHRPKQEICVVASEVPHPLQNITLTNLNGQMIPWNDPNPPPYTAELYQCTSSLPNTKCIRNLSNSSILFGTDTLTAGVTEFCGTDIPIIFMADTNVGMGYVATGSLFLEEPLRSLANDATENAYTCCNDTSYGGVLNAFASDRIAVTSTALTMDRLEGGSVAPNGLIPFGMQYQCAATEEHLPLRAHISFQN